MFLHILCFLQTSPAILADKDIVVAEILKKWVPSFDLEESNTTLHHWKKNVLNQAMESGNFRSETKQGQHVFDMITVVNSIGISATSLSNHLQNLKVRMVFNGKHLSSTLLSFSILTKYGQCTWVVCIFKLLLLELYSDITLHFKMKLLSATQCISIYQFWGWVNAC